MKNVYELCARYDARQSFYGKALVECKKGKKVLYSYLTEVATIKDNGAIRLTQEAICSPTTLRHIKEFVRQETGKEYTKKDLLVFVR